MLPSLIEQSVSTTAAPDQAGPQTAGYDQALATLGHACAEQDGQPLPLIMTLPLIVVVSLVLWAGILRFAGMILHN